MKILDAVFIEVVLTGVCIRLGLPETTPLKRFGPRIIAFVLDEAFMLQSDALKDGSIAVLRHYGHPLTFENWMTFNNLTEEDCVGEMLESIPDLFQPEAIAMRVDEVMDRIEVDEVLRKLEEKK